MIVDRFPVATKLGVDDAGSAGGAWSGGGGAWHGGGGAGGACREGAGAGGQWGGGGGAL